MNRKNVLLMMIVATNLRLSVTALAPLFAVVQHDLQVNNTVTALLVTIPLICFSGGVLLAPLLIQRLGIKMLLMITSAALAVGNLLRPISQLNLIGGTVIVELAIALLNIVVPTMIAQEGRAQTTRLTSYYSVVMNATAAVGTAIAIPLASVIGWRMVVASFAILAVLALIGTPLLVSPDWTPNKKGSK